MNRQKVPSTPVLLIKGMFVICLVMIMISAILTMMTPDVEQIEYTEEQSRIIHECDQYYYEKQYGQLREYLYSNKLYDEPYDVYWEMINGYADYIEYVTYKKGINLQKTEEYKKKVIQNANRCRYEKNQKELDRLKRVVSK